MRALGHAPVIEAPGRRRMAPPLLSAAAMHQADMRRCKIDLGPGAYRNEDGATPLMRAVGRAHVERMESHRKAGGTGIEKNLHCVDLLAEVALGAVLATDQNMIGVMPASGSGPLRLAAAYLGRLSQTPVVWAGIPSWPDHAPILQAAGLAVRSLPIFDATQAGLDFDAFVEPLRHAAKGDVVLLSGCCHNPTGAYFSADQWRELTALILQLELVPLIDLSSQGFGAGLEEDAAGTRAMLARVPRAFVAYSCDQCFGLRSNRVGVLWAKTASASEALSMRDSLRVLADSLRADGADEDADTVSYVLNDPALAAEWRAELAEMRVRICRLRQALGSGDRRLERIATQQGLFALLPLDDAGVTVLRRDHAIYMPASARINVTCLTAGTVSRFLAALSPLLDSQGPSLDAQWSRN